MHRDWSNTYKFLHWTFAPLIALQLVLSLFMSSKKQGLPYLLFNIHVTIGPILVGVIIALWIYILTNASIRSHFFPYNRWDEVVNDFKNLIKFKLAETGPRPGLPGFVHGLGLIDVSIVLVAGVIMHFLFPFSLKDPSLKPIVHFFMEIHDFFGNSMWVYMVGHASMALLHRIVSK